MSLVVTGVAGLVTIQDLGRPGRMHEGLPRGGALVPELLVDANHAARNPPGAPAIEVIGRVALRAESAVIVATDARPARQLAPGDEVVVEAEPRRVTYLAVRGGLAAPEVLGGRGAHLSAGLGRLLRAGDVCACGGLAACEAPGEPVFVEGGPIRVIPGPDLGAFAGDALAVLTSRPYRVLPASDRVGTRLDGPALRPVGDLATSRPMVRGALEVPRDGLPIALGPEHPTTGGYPLVGVIATADLGRFHAIRLGDLVRFVT